MSDRQQQGDAERSYPTPGTGDGASSMTGTSQGDTHTYPTTTVPTGLSGFTAGWDEAAPAYRQEFEQRAQGSGRRWEEAEPAHRYGHTVVQHERYQGREWQDAEPELRQGYSEWSREQGHSHDDTAWETAKDDVRSIWDRARGKQG